MDDNHHLHHHPYGVAELRQLINGRPQQAPYPPSQHLEIIMMGHQVVPRPDGLCEFHTESARIPGAAAGNGAGFAASSSALEAEAGGCVAGDGASTRWPRQETLTLLEIRSRLDSRFREANHKGPLWDEVSRIMGEEHGYQRSGKKCREKFENLYKYYKKTKEGKAGRQDGKHYRFFRQLEALYGDHISTNAPVSVPESQSLAQSLPYHPSLMDPQQSNGNNNKNNQETTTASLQSHKLSDSLSLSNYSSDFGTSSSDNVDCSGTNLPVENVSAGKKRRGRRSWKAKIKEFIDSKMRKLMEKQEAMVEKMMRALEEKEHERVLREEEWKKQEVARVEKEHKFWAQERAWIEARDAALMDALQNLTSKSSHHHFVGVDHEVGSHNAGNIRGIPVTSADDAKSKEYGSKKRKENQSRCYNYYNQSNGDSLYNQGVGYCEAARIQLNDGLSPSNSNAGNSVHDSGFPFLMNDGDNLWENYGMKLNKGGDD